MQTCDSVPRTYDHYGNRDNNLRSRIKWLLDTMGIDELRARILKDRKLLLASVTWAHGIPDYVKEHGDEPAGISASLDATPVGQDVGVNVTLKGLTPRTRWEDANVVRGAAKGTVSAYAYARLADITSA